MKTQYIFGKIPVLECLRAGKRPARNLFMLSNAKGLDEIRESAAGVPVESRSRRDLDALAGGGVHQGVVLEADPIPVLDLEHWLAQPRGKSDLIVLLDGIEDPQNLGAIVRSAAACGAQAVVFTKDRAAPVSPTMIKSAAGAVEYIDLVRVTNLVRAIDRLKQNEFWIAALDPSSDRLLWDADLTGRIGLVIGGEGKGIRRLVLEHCDHRLRIPMSGPINSLNASVSAGVALAECLRQRRK